MKCPYCKKEDFIPSYVSMNVECYGSKTVRFNCLHCKRVVKAYGSRYVEFSSIMKTDQESDWS